MKITLKYGNEEREYIEKLQGYSYPCFAKVRNHVEHTRAMGLPVQNILDFTNVAKRFPNIPSVRQRIVKDAQPITLDERTQFWMLDRFKEVSPYGLPESELLKAWSHTWGSGIAFCNKTGPDKINKLTGELEYADFVRRTGLGRKGFKLQPTISHNTTILVTRPPFYEANQWRVEYETINVYDGSMFDKTCKGHWWLFCPAVSWSREWINPTTENPYGVTNPLKPFGQANPFPHFTVSNQNTPHFAPPVPMLGNGVGYIELDWIDFIDAESAPIYPYGVQL